MVTKIFQRGLGLKSEVKAPLNKDYQGCIVDLARSNGYCLRAGDLTFRLAKELGFCYGVDRAVGYAYETRKRFPDKTIYITGEIIHNPFVNSRLESMAIRFLNGTDGSEEKFAPVTSNDVVLLPAFGVSTTELEVLSRKGCILVDTTCGSVLNVWKNVDRYASNGFTSIIHGKYWHEETKATISRAVQGPDSHYLVVRDMEETQAVCPYIEQGGDAASFVERFSKSSSPGFDPVRHLEKIGLANQTTMLSSESMAIRAALQETMVRRYGKAEAANRFLSFDTICSATQDRQDAVVELAGAGIDLMLVIGGYNSSNTTHLAGIAHRRCPTYHIENSRCLVSADEIRHKPAGQAEVTSRDWLAPGPRFVGVTAGASTPDVQVDELVRRVLSFRGLSPEDLEPA